MAMIKLCATNFNFPFQFMDLEKNKIKNKETIPNYYTIPNCN